MSEDLLTAQLQDAITFLQWLRPEGPWSPTAIPPEKGPTHTATFRPGEEKELLAWLEEHSGRRNLYFTVNPTMRSIASKAKKEDIEELAWLHVDIDPAKGQDPAEARAEALEKVRAFKPPPSLIIDSGGGIQAFWRLKDPIYIGGSIPAAEECEAYNLQLEIMLGGDSCHNVDRIMRLPGTINLPNEKKRKAGREPRLASIIEQHDDRVYDTAEFTAAARVQADDNGGLAAPSVKISGNLPRLKDLDELPEAVTPRTRMLIVQGDDPDDQLRYASRSEVTFAVCCELVRAGCDDDTIAAVLLDPDFGISAHTLAQKRSVEYAARQIERAREEVVEPMLRRLNERHAVISDIGGKCRVISEVLDQNLAQPRKRISKQSFEDFRNRYMNVKVQTGTTKAGDPTYTPAGKWWLEHPMRRQFDTLVFAPGREPEGAYNLWQGFACEAIPGAGHEPFLEHLQENVCQGNEEHYSYLIRWMARAVQNPGEQGHVAVVLRGGRGAGKGTVAQGFGSLWGRHFLHITNAKHLVGQFNAHLRDCAVLFADEAFFAGDKQHESILQMLVTEDTIPIEGKGVDMEVAPNYVHMIMASNDQWVVPAGEDERRYFILDVGEGKKQDLSYFRAIRRALNEGGREALLHHLMTMDLTGFEVRAVPQTEALRDQKLLSLNTEEQWWLERLMDGRITAKSHGWLDSVQKEFLQSDYLRYTENQRLMRRSSPTALGRFLRRVMEPLNRGLSDAEKWPRSVQRMSDVERQDGQGHVYTTRERVYWYDIPELEACRRAWDERFGGNFGWPSVSESNDEAPSSNNDPY